MKIIVLFIARRENGVIKSVGYFGSYSDMTLTKAEHLTQTKGEWIKNGNIYKCLAPFGGEYVLQWEELNDYNNLLTEFKNELNNKL